ncbi:MAG: LytTR family DNA-binding domain-containing protein [Arcicella sp.]|jgi:DNA-binding LytR/AlgR family response regulator|nr:LytTR family DNA-binding domain-containing protein [Arcicella sp.]
MSSLYNCVLIEDNPIDTKIIEGHLRKLPHLRLLSVFENPIDSIQTIHAGEVDIIFMDIEMPEMSGITFLNSLDTPPQVILISNHVNYSMEAFEIGVTDYIQKPVSFERLLKAVSRAINGINIQEKSLRELITLKDQHIFLKSGRELLKFNLNDILYIEALASFTKVFTPDKTTIISESISELQEKLAPYSFIRVHKSYLVPQNKIVGISTKNVILEKNKIPMGLSYREEIEKILENI